MLEEDREKILDAFQKRDNAGKLELMTIVLNGMIGYEKLYKEALQQKI